jgi:serine/threonine protein kinase
MLAIKQILRDRYVIKDRIAQGGMGVVYEAEDKNRFNTPVAVKEILFDLTKVASQKQKEQVLWAFEREAKILTRLDHPAFPRVLEYIIDVPFPILVMDLVSGDDLGDLIQQGKSPFPLNEVAQWADQLFDALHYLHTFEPEPVFHRDIKPQNIKITQKGKVKLLDFGIAKGGENQAFTVTNLTFLGASRNYSPVEQFLKVIDQDYRYLLQKEFDGKINKFIENKTDARSDIFALGATFYHLLTGILPEEAINRARAVWSGRPDTLEKPTAINSKLSRGMENFLLKAMELDPDKRFQSAMEMKEHFHLALLPPTEPSPFPPDPIPFPKPPRRRFDWIKYLKIVSFVAIPVIILAVVLILLKNITVPKNSNTNSERSTNVNVSAGVVNSIVPNVSVDVTPKPTITKTQTPKPRTFEPKYNATVTSGGGYIRKIPSTTAEEAGEAMSGERLIVGRRAGVNSQFYFVTTESGVSGWMSGNLFTMDEDSP